MTEYRIVWQACPHIHNRRQVTFVEAASEMDAIAIVRDHAERTQGITWLTIHETGIAPSVPAGRVVSHG